MRQMSSPTLTRWQPWTFHDLSWLGNDLSGYVIEAVDGDIGTVDKASGEVANSYLIANTDGLILGRKVMLPAGVVSGIDHVNRRVFVDRTKDQIKNAPQFDDLHDAKYRDRLGTYFGEGGPGWTPR
jgi:hypothetical protein